MKFTKIFEKCLFGSNIGPFYINVHILQSVRGDDSRRNGKSLRKHAHATYRKRFGCKDENFQWKILIFFLFLLKT